MASVDVRHEAWRDDAACKGRDGNLWFPTGDLPAESLALQVCRACPVQADCLAYATRHGIEHGIWGGVTEQERRRRHRR